MPEANRIVGKYRCPRGHEFEVVQTPIMAQACSEHGCGATAYRLATQLEPLTIVSTTAIRAALAKGAAWLKSAHEVKMPGALETVTELHTRLGELLAVCEKFADHREPTPADSLAKLRAAGWMISCHNDYRQGGQRMTYWSFARGSQYVKGEGATDTEALAACAAAAAALPDAETW